MEQDPTTRSARPEQTANVQDGPIQRSVTALRQHTRQVLSPWVQHRLPTSPARPAPRRPTTLVVGNVRTLLRRVQRTLDRATVWKPDAGAFKHTLVQQFSSAVAGRFTSPLLVSVQRQAALAAPAWSDYTELTLPLGATPAQSVEGAAGARVKGPSIFSVGQRIEPMRSATPVLPAAPRPQAPPQAAQRPPQKQPPSKSRLYTRVEEITPAGSAPPPAPTTALQRSEVAEPPPREEPEAETAELPKLQDRVSAEPLSGQTTPPIQHQPAQEATARPQAGTAHEAPLDTQVSIPSHTRIEPATAMQPEAPGREPPVQPERLAPPEQMDTPPAPQLPEFTVPLPTAPAQQGIPPQEPPSVLPAPPSRPPQASPSAPVQRQAAQPPPPKARPPRQAPPAQPPSAPATPTSTRPSAPPRQPVAKTTAQEPAGELPPEPTIEPELPLAARQAAAIESQPETAAQAEPAQQAPQIPPPIDFAPAETAKPAPVQRQVAPELTLREPARPTARAEEQPIQSPPEAAPPPPVQPQEARDVVPPLPKREQPPSHEAERPAPPSRSLLTRLASHTQMALRKPLPLPRHSAVAVQRRGERPSQARPHPASTSPAALPLSSPLASPTLYDRSPNLVIGPTLSMISRIERPGRPSARPGGEQIARQSTAPPVIRPELSTTPTSHPLALSMPFRSPPSSLPSAPLQRPTPPDSPGTIQPDSLAAIQREIRQLFEADLPLAAPPAPAVAPTETIQRQTAPAAVLTSISQAPAAPQTVVRRVEGLDIEPEAQDLTELARRVVPFVKRLLAIERERRPGGT